MDRVEHSLLADTHRRDRNALWKLQNREKGVYAGQRTGDQRNPNYRLARERGYNARKSGRQSGRGDPFFDPDEFRFIPP